MGSPLAPWTIGEPVGKLVDVEPRRGDRRLRGLLLSQEAE